MPLNPPYRLGGAPSGLIKPPNASPPAPIGRWYMDTFQRNASNKGWARVPNAVATTGVDTVNLLPVAQRTGCSNTIFTPANGWNYEAATAPDGSNNAAQLTLSTGQNGYFAAAGTDLNFSGGNVTYAAWVRLASGSGSFSMGNLYQNTNMQAIAVDGTWRRFAVTMANVLDFYPAFQCDSGAGGVLEVWGWDGFLGTSDLRPNVGDQPALAGHLWLYPTMTYSGGALDTVGANPSHGWMQFPTAVDPLNFTFLTYIQTLAQGAQNYTNIVSPGDPVQGYWDHFAVGPNQGSGVGAMLNGNAMLSQQDATGAERYELWDTLAKGYYVYGITGQDLGGGNKRVRCYVNGIRILEFTMGGFNTPIESFYDLFFGRLASHFPKFKVNSLVLWDKELTPDQVKTETTTLVTRAASSGLSLVSFKLLMADGNQDVKGYVYDVPGKAVGFVRGANFGSTNATLSTLTGRVSNITRISTDSLTAPNTPKVLVVVDIARAMLFGSNGADGAYKGNAAGAITALQSYLTSMAASNVKRIVLGARSANAGANQATYDSDRATLNAAVNNFVSGGYAEAVIDLSNASGDANLGPNAAYSNVTYFAANGIDLTATGNGILSTAVAAACDTF